ncbi:MAG: hypothetical protein A2Z47_15870 [Thermodesulfovibrio sp. RBG_19FT_COMBO_42_12]|nr:MAG: hypothetical protein A2Z47_15870 [Thermodesulfovibrio sp. RBG_19FT_COMBO_42_12]
MSKTNEWTELKETIRLFTVWTVSSLIDSSFLALWVTIQWVVSSKVVTPLILTGIDQLVLTIFQILFAISTLAPVANTIYRDIRIMILRTQRKIRSEIKIGEYNEPD